MDRKSCKNKRRRGKKKAHKPQHGSHDLKGELQSDMTLPPQIFLSCTQNKFPTFTAAKVHVSDRARHLISHSMANDAQKYHPERTCWCLNGRRYTEKKADIFAVNVWLARLSKQEITFLVESNNWKFIIYSSSQKEQFKVTCTARILPGSITSFTDQLTQGITELTACHPLVHYHRNVDEIYMHERGITMNMCTGKICLAQAR